MPTAADIEAETKSGLAFDGSLQDIYVVCLRERDMFLDNSYSIKESETLIHNMSNINVCIVKLIKPMCEYQQCFYLIGSQYIISLRDGLQQGVVHFEHMITHIVKSCII